MSSYYITRHVQTDKYPHNNNPLGHGQQWCKVLFPSKLPRKVMVRKKLPCVNCDIDLGDMTSHAESRLWYDCVLYYQDPTWQWEVMTRTRFWVCVHCDLDPGDMTVGQGHDTSCGYGQQFCELLSRSNLAIRSYDPDTDFGYVCTMTLTLEIWPWAKIMKHP